MAIETIIQKTSITDVASVTQTPITQDNDGKYVREFRVFGVPVAGIAPLIFSMKVSGDTEEAVELTAPPQTF